MKKYLFVFLVLLLETVYFNESSLAKDKPPVCFHNKEMTKWGFFGHQRINRLAIFCLPIEMIPFYKANLQYLVEHSVDPDRRRYAVDNEAPKHFIDMDAYGDSARTKLPFFWKDAVAKHSEDTLLKHGIVPWHIQLMKFELTNAMKLHETRKVLKLSAEIGHYIADANVPLHTTRNYNGQFTDQIGIHAFWESRLPELYVKEYDFFVGPATYLKSTQERTWQAVFQANACLDSVLKFEKRLSNEEKVFGKYTFEERNGVTVRTQSKEFSQKYHTLLANQVERQMRAAIKMVADFWYTAWIDAGQPDLSFMLTYKKTDAEIKEEQLEENNWQNKKVEARPEN